MIIQIIIRTKNDNDDNDNNNNNNNDNSNNKYISYSATIHDDVPGHTM